MQYAVEGKIFNDINEARDYEIQLEEARRKVKEEQEKSQLVEQTKFFEVTRDDGFTFTLAVVVDNDHFKYAHALMESMYGKRFEVVNGVLHTNWVVREVKDKALIEELTGILVGAIPALRPMTVYQPSASCRSRLRHVLDPMSMLSYTMFLHS